MPTSKHFLLLLFLVSTAMLACNRRPTPSSSSTDAPPAAPSSASHAVVEERAAPGASWVGGTRIRVKVAGVRDQVPGVLGAPPAGTKNVALDLQFENDRGAGPYTLPTLLGFYRLKGADGREYLPNWMLPNAQPMLQPGAIGVGDSKRGWANYQVPSDLDLATARFQYEFEGRATDWIPLAVVMKPPPMTGGSALSKRSK